MLASATNILTHARSQYLCAVMQGRSFSGLLVLYWGPGGARVLYKLTLRMKLWLRRPSAVGRLKGSLCMHCSTKSCSSGLMTPSSGSGTGSLSTCKTPRHHETNAFDCSTGGFSFMHTSTKSCSSGLMTLSSGSGIDHSAPARQWDVCRDMLLSERRRFRLLRIRATVQHPEM